MCRSSTITIGSAAAILRLRPPEVDEADQHSDHCPAYGVVPVVARVSHRMAVGAVIEDLGRVPRMVMGPLQALRRVEGHRAWLAQPLRFQQGIAYQRDVQRGR